jgi:hypothetical protein
MKVSLAKRGVVIKLRTGTITATVYEEEDGGVWVQPSSNAGLKDFPAGVKAPLMFVPFSQMEWLVTPMTAAELTRH